MGAVITSTMTIVLLFNGPITPTDIDVIRPAVEEESATTFFITEDGKLIEQAEPTDADWGLSRYPNAAGIEIRVTDIDPEKSSAMLQEIERALEQLPEGRARVASVSGGGGKSGRKGAGPGNANGAMGFGGGGRPTGSYQARTQRGAEAAPYAAMALGSMAGMPRRGPVVLEGDLQLTPEESARWHELDARARQLAARYKGEESALPRWGAFPGGAPGMMGGRTGPWVSTAPTTEGPQPTPTAEEQEEIEKELTDLLNQMFDLKLIAYERKITGIEEELQSLRNEIEERKENKKLIVERRLNELTGKQDHLAW
jgi:hypothetical protein